MSRTTSHVDRSAKPQLYIEAGLPPSGAPVYCFGMEEHPLAPCPVCACKEATHIYTTDGYRFFRCMNCRTAYVDPVPSEQTLLEYYAAFHLSSEQGGCYDWIEERIASTFDAKARLVESATHGKPGRLLDVGCGKGLFIQTCVARGIDAMGTDLSASGVEYATRKLGVKAICGQLEDIRTELGFFDTVTCWATLEHVPDGHALMRNIAGVLRPGGVVFVMTCAGDDLVERMLPGVTQWYHPPEHLVIYSRRGVRRLMESEGFVVDKIDMCWETTRMRRLARLVRNFGASAGLGLVTRAARFQMKPDSLPRFPLGNDMMTIAHKPRTE